MKAPLLQSVPFKGWHAPRISGFAVAAVIMASLVAPAAVLADMVTYYESVYGTTASEGVRIGLGNQIFQNKFTYLTFTFEGDTSDVSHYQKPQAEGYKISTGTATVEIHDFNGTLASATFDAGEIYVSTDITNGGVGFSSRIYPIYPYALLVNSNLPNAPDLSQPTYDLKHEFSYDYYAISCVGFAAGNGCQNAPPNGPNNGLHTDKGDFWVESQGITSATFSVELQSVPAPGALSLGLLGLGLLGARRKCSPC